MKYLNGIIRFFLICCLLSGASCIREDITELCPEDIRIYFSYLDNGGNTRQRGINPADVDRIHLFVYDENGILYTDTIDNSPVFSPDYYITLSLLPGTYQLIAWGGDHVTDYTVVPETGSAGRISADEEVLSLNRSLGNEIDRIQHHLFYAGPEKKAIVRGGNERFVLPLIQDTYTINISLDCYEFTENKLEVHVWDDNGSYGFDNSFIADSLHYSQSFVADGLNQYNGMVRLMRLAEHRKPTMALYDATLGKKLLEFNLVKLLVDMYENGLLHDLDFEHLYEYDIPFTLCPGNNDGKIEIRVDMDAWHLVIDGIILKPME